MNNDKIVKEMCREILSGLHGDKSSTIYSHQSLLKEMLTAPDSVLFERIVDVGEEFCEIVSFIDEKFESHLQNGSVGLYLLACVEYLDKSLTPYRQRLVSLESEPACLSHIYRQIYPYSEVTKALVDMIREIDTSNIRGTAILETIHNHFNSNTRAAQVSINLIYKGVSILLLTQLQAWLLYGEIVDTRNEFFIQKREKNLQNTPFKDYCLNSTRLPSFIKPIVAEKILNVGQTVLYLRSGPDKHNESISSEEVIDLSGITGKSADNIITQIKEASETPVWQQWQYLENIVESAASVVTTQLHKLAMVDACLLQQLHMIKDIYLMGRGELFHEFVTQYDQLYHSGLNPDVNVLLHSCAVNVLIREEALAPFTLELAESDAGKIFNIRYKVPWPLELLFPQNVMDAYNQVFLFLLRLKRIQVRMVNSWLRDKSKRKFVVCVKRRQLQNNLWFLVNNLQYYLQVDVLESQFVTLVNAVQTSKNFEDIRLAHSRFLSNLIVQSFLNTPQDAKGIESPVQQRLNNILKLCEDFCAQSEGKDRMSDDIVECLSLKFDTCFSHLFALLAALKKHAGHPCSQHLGQLLLRLDFNRFLSAKSNPEFVLLS